MKNDSKDKVFPFIRKLCSHLSEKEIIEADERFKEHIKIAMRIIEREEKKKSTTIT